MHRVVWAPDMSPRACRVTPQQQQQFTVVRTNHDIRIVEAALKTIRLCAGEEPRRGLAAQRPLSADRPATAAVSTSVCISVTLTQFQFSMKADIALGQRINTFMLNPFSPIAPSVHVCVSASACPVRAQERRDGGGVGGESQFTETGKTMSQWADRPLTDRSHNSIDK